MPDVRDLERVLFGRAHDEGDENVHGMTQLSTGQRAPRDRERLRLRVDEIEMLLRDRQELGHANGHAEGWEAASEVYRAQQKVDITNTARGTLSVVLADLTPAVERVLAARKALSEHPRAGASKKLVVDATAGLEEALDGVRRLLAQVQSDGIRLP